MAARHSTNGKRKRHSAKRLLIPAVGYIRMSSDKQEASPEQQKADILKLAEREGYRIIRWRGKGDTQSYFAPAALVW